jgi:hypothetical protein
MTDHKAELERLRDEYRILLKQAYEANECNNLGGLGRFHTAMLLNFGKKLEIDNDIKRGL